MTHWCPMRHLKCSMLNRKVRTLTESHKAPPTTLFLHRCDRNVFCGHMDGGLLAGEPSSWTLTMHHTRGLEESHDSPAQPQTYEPLRLCEPITHLPLLARLSMHVLMYWLYESI